MCKDIEQYSDQERQMKPINFPGSDFLSVTTVFFRQVTSWLWVLFLKKYTSILLTLLILWEHFDREMRKFQGNPHTFTNLSLFFLFVSSFFFWDRGKREGLLLISTFPSWGNPIHSHFPFRYQVFQNLSTRSEYCIPVPQLIQSCLTLHDPMNCSPPGSSFLGILGKSPRVGCRALLQRIFPTQESNSCLLCLLHCRQIVHPLNCLGSSFQHLFLTKRWVQKDNTSY